MTAFSEERKRLRPGRVVVLNGTSSAGKSTLSRALQALMQETRRENWWHLQMDTFAAMQPPGWDVDEYLVPFLSGWYQCIHALALTGNNVIAEAGFLKMEWLFEQAEALDGIEALYVGVRCPLEETERRELTRADRPPGCARSQYDAVHCHGPYDVEVDTSVLGPEEVAHAIRAALDAPPASPAFARVREQHRRQTASGTTGA